jgi:hypothetical protein
MVSERERVSSGPPRVSICGGEDRSLGEPRSLGRPLIEGRSPAGTCPEARRALLSASSRIHFLVATEDLPKLSFHDLRHTAITHLIRAGADAFQVQRFAGHAKPSITLDIYVGEFEARKSNDVGKRLSAAFNGVSERKSDHNPTQRTRGPGKGPLLCGRLARFGLTEPLARDGRYWARTSDPQLVELVLSQLS